MTRCICTPFKYDPSYISAFGYVAIPLPVKSRDEFDVSPVSMNTI